MKTRVGVTAALSFVVVSLFCTSIAWAGPRLAIYKNIILYLAGDTGGSFTINNEGDQLLEWSTSGDLPWFWADPASGTVEAGSAFTVGVFVDRTGIPDGDYEGLLTISSNGGGHTLRIRMIVQNAPKLRVGNFLVTLSLTQTSSQFFMTNDGVQPLEWSVSGDQPWIIAGPPVSGTLPYDEFQAVTVRLDASGLPTEDEEHFGGVIVSSNGGTRTVQVRYTPNIQAGVLGTYQDTQGTDCDLSYPTPGLASVYIVHTQTTGATAVQFSAPKPACWTNAVFLSDTDVYPVTIGNSQVGKAVGYGACVSAPIVVTTVNYFVQSPPAEPCCPYPVLPDPNVPSGRIEVVDCDNSLVFGEGAIGILNGDNSCLCEDVLPVEKTTWGRLKAMYAPESADGE